MSYPKRLIEVDLPIKRISEHARREKSIRHGHISTLHIWWARRPLAACRAVICAALWPDPVDELCPQAFRDAAAQVLCDFAAKVRQDAKLAALAKGTWTRWNRTNEQSLRGSNPGHWPEMRYALLDFIAEFANWDASTVPEFLDASRALTQAAHESLGGEPGSRPLVVDPFAGGGAIPFEALRIGADTFASDINPIAALINKVMLEYIPGTNEKLHDEVLKWGNWVKNQVEADLAEFYPKDADGATPIAYLWARCITCEGPDCGAEIPLLRSTWISRKATRSVAIGLKPDRLNKRVTFELIENAKPKIVQAGTTRHGSATCPICGYTTPVESVRRQLKKRRGGTQDARLFCVVTTKPGYPGRNFRLPTDIDELVVRKAADALARLQIKTPGSISKIPNEPLPPDGTLGFRIQKYGMENWGDLFTARQALSLTKLAEACHSVASQYDNEQTGTLVSILLSFALSRTQDLNASTSTWASTIQAICGANRAQNRMPMVWDFVEANPLGESGGNWLGQVNWIIRVIDHLQDANLIPGRAEQSPAQESLLPRDSAQAIVTDPPYYDAFGYSDLSDFFLSWLKRSLPSDVVNSLRLSNQGMAPKDLEIVVNPGAESDGRGAKGKAWFENQISVALEQSRVVLHPSGIGIVVFANKSTAGWEALLEGLLKAGWTITGSWPIDTERPNRQRAQDSAALNSSIHLVCRPRENEDGTLREQIGNWRDILQELPERIHEWMPRLSTEGVVGADAIFACLGPALEIFSRYSRVEKANGDVVLLREYLEHVWGSVAREALGLIFEGAEATAFEPDARLTAMWLWTLTAGTASANGASSIEIDENAAEIDEHDTPKGNARLAGFELEYDAARKIAQGLGVHLEDLQDLVQVKGDKARLLPVAERVNHLFDTKASMTNGSVKVVRKAQLSMFEAMGEVVTEPVAQETGRDAALKAAHTTLDRVHQAMLLFAAGRSEGLRHFLVDDGIGRDKRFWSLAQSLSALYPSAIDEKRWVDGVLARKKGLGF